MQDVTNSRTKGISIDLPDTEVLDGSGGMVEDLLKVNNLAARLLQLLKAGDEVPEAALRDHFVGGKDGHLEKLRLGVLLGGKLAADNLVLVQLES